jgi:hypothetical protein
MTQSKNWNLIPQTLVDVRRVGLLSGLGALLLLTTSGGGLLSGFLKRGKKIALVK